MRFLPQPQMLKLKFFLKNNFSYHKPLLGCSLRSKFFKKHWGKQCGFPNNIFPVFLALYTLPNGESIYTTVVVLFGAVLNFFGHSFHLCWEGLYPFSVCRQTPYWKVQMVSLGRYCINCATKNLVEYIGITIKVNSYLSSKSSSSRER